MAHFSSALKLTDLNDFISPGTECIKPFAFDKKGGEGATMAKGQVTEANDPSAADGSKKRANISLEDCLACSGCVTSAETVLVTEQSLEEFIKLSELRKLKSSDLRICVTISFPCILSLAHKMHITCEEAFLQLSYVLRQEYAVDHVFETTMARELSVMAARLELEEEIRKESAQRGSSRLPLLSSSCPGWVCYAEKRAGSWILDHLSRVKSEQQLMALLIRDIWARDQNIDPRTLRIVSVAPCFDRKLEAARREFVQIQPSSSEAVPLREVALVLALREIEAVLLERGAEVAKMAEAVGITPVRGGGILFPSPTLREEWLSSLIPLGPMGLPQDQVLDDSNDVRLEEEEEEEEEKKKTMPIPWQIKSDGAGHSGGYAQAMAALVLGSTGASRPSLVFEAPGKRTDWKECLIKNKNNELGSDWLPSRDLRFVTAYGFRHIQNLLRQMKKEKAAHRSDSSAHSHSQAITSSTPVDDKPFLLYVEVMACPGGCLNGGGLLKHDEAMAAQAWWQSVSSMAAGLEVEAVDENMLLQGLIREQGGREWISSHVTATQFVDRSTPSEGLSW